MSEHHEPSPVNPLPLAVVLLFLAIVLPEAAFSLGAHGWVGGPDAIGWRLAAVQQYGFSSDIFDWMLQNNRWLPEHLIRFVTYPLVHVGFTSTLFAAVILLAMGKLVSEVMGQIALLVIFFGAGIFGALIYALLLNDPIWLYGAFPNVYGLIGGYTFVLWQKLGAAGQQQLRAFSLIAMLMGLQLMWGIFFETDNGWVADLAGFAFGLGASVLLVPGGWAQMIAHLRRD